jgi:hypothetical protein
LNKSAVARALKLELGNLQVASGCLASPLIGLDIERDLLAFNESAQAGALERAHMDEDVLAAIIGLNEAVAFLAVVPFHDTHIHGEVLSLAMHNARQNL